MRDVNRWRERNLLHYGGLAILLAATALACTKPSATISGRTNSPTRRLWCHAGPGIAVNTRYDLHFAQVHVSYLGSSGTELFGDLLVDLTVTPATASAGPDGRALPPGSCAYADAPMTSAEPRRLRWHGALRPGIALTWHTADGATSTPAVSSVFDPLGRTEPYGMWADLAPGEGSGEQAITAFSIDPW
jgi:hypothetical protein